VPYVSADQGCEGRIAANRPAEYLALHRVIFHAGVPNRRIKRESYG
jgi:hypothetical protein